LNIVIVSHGFRERAKAKSKTARDCHRRSKAAALVQHPAILPWPSDLPRYGAGNCPFQESAALLPGNGERIMRRRASGSCRAPIVNDEYQVAR
jgi:hypothetical protein